MKIMRSPRSVDIDITNQCNLRCGYCAHFTSAGDVGSDLPAEEWLRFFEELGQSGVMRVCFEGGEPFFRKDIFTLIDGVVRNGMRFSVLSNGTLINDEIAALLARTRRCDRVQVSIDGSNSETHDSFRGAGTFSRAVDGIKSLQRHNISVSVRVTIHKANLYALDRIAEFLLDELRLPNFSTNSASFMGLCRKNADAIQLTTREYSLAIESLLRLNMKYNGRIQALAGPLASGRRWLDMEFARKEGRGDAPGCGFLSSCNGPMKVMAVRADGVMIPCIQLNHVELGRINIESITNIWQNHSQLKALRERRMIPLESLEYCKGCDYIHYCMGNCPAIAYTTMGREDCPSPDACLKMFLESGGELPRAKEYACS